MAAPAASNPLRSYQEHSREVGTLLRHTVRQNARTDVGLIVLLSLVRDMWQRVDAQDPGYVLAWLLFRRTEAQLLS